MIIEGLLLFAILALLWNFINSLHRRFENAGVPYAPVVPILGSVWRSILKKCNISEDVQKIYNETGDDTCRYIGLYQFTTPIILIKDLELLKQVTVKDFDHFVNHQPFTSDIDSHEELFDKSLFAMRDQKWKDMRSTLSPAFTSAKIKNMCQFISDCGLQTTNYLKEISKDKKCIELEFKELSSRYANDVIATAAFGLKVDSFKDQQNEFLLMGKKIGAVTTIQMIKFFIKIWLPRIGKILRLRMSEIEVTDFFKNLVLNAMDYREKNKIVRPDMIHLLMETKKGSLTHEGASDDKDAGFATVEESDVGTRQSKQVWTDDDLVAQAFLFFIAGFETTSTIASFIFYELALNQEVQKKVQSEIDLHLANKEKNITYEIIQKMKYIDMVVSEGLRKWPPAPQVDRQCTKDFNLGPIRHGQDTETYTIKAKELVWIPIMYVHHDSKYWEEPEKFDPERFSDENKHKINPMAFIPFGSGPRNCIGSRFALVELKMLLVHVLSEFTVEPCSKTNIPMKLLPDLFNLKSKNGFWFKFVQRSV